MRNGLILAKRLYQNLHLHFNLTTAIMKKITITIEVEYGSEYQEFSLKQMLEVFLKAWSEFGNNSHKQNKITYEIDTHDGYKTTQY